MFYQSGESGHACLVPQFTGEAFGLSPSSPVLAVGLAEISFILWRYVPSIPRLVSGFFIHECGVLSNGVTASVETIMWFLSFLLKRWCISL